MGILEDELNLPIKNYPEVIYLGRGVIPETIGLSPSLTSCVEDSKKSRVSRFLYKPNIVLITEDLPEHINEESAHCVHLNTARVSLYNRTREDWFSLNILIEMFGYIGSKILDPSRKNVYAKYPDYFALARKGGLDCRKAIKNLQKLDELKELDMSEFLIHSQGYSLGERMFFALESGDLDIGYISKLMKRNFKKENSARDCLISLRRRFWPI